jgi:hypothetical protein
MDPNREALLRLGARQCSKCGSLDNLYSFYKGTTECRSCLGVDLYKKRRRADDASKS